MGGLVLVSPLKGWASSLDEVPDPVFSDRILGDGLAIDPTDSTLYAPCDGVVIAAAKHAVTLRAGNGAEILMHVGLETVALNGKGFVSQVSEGKAVKTGDALLSFDLEFLAARAKSLISPIVLVNGEQYRIVKRTRDRELAVGETLMELEAVNGAETATGGAAQTASRAVVVALAHGLHARPAAVLATAAKRYGAETAVVLGAKRANAKSVASLMSLGVKLGDTVAVEASGTDAEAAVATLADLIKAGLGETPVEPGAPSAAPVAAAPRLEQPSGDPDLIRGVTAAPGLALGKAFRFRAAEIAVAETGEGSAREARELKRALSEARANLERSAATGDRQRRDILAAHIALLGDPELEAAALALIEKGKSAGFAWRAALRGFADTYRAMDDARMRERASDLLDLERQVLAALTGKEPARIALPQDAIVVAEELLPSDLAALDGVAGIATAGGGPTSHVAIIAAGMNVPALVGMGAALERVADGAEVLLDADAGTLRLNPDAPTVAKAKAAIAARAQRRAEALASAAEECTTADGVRIEIFANLGRGATEAEAAVRMGAEGCGLLRTEFLFLGRDTPPSRDEQYRQYQAIAEALQGRPFILRTFDIGGDKPAPYLTFPPEENPMLGLRGIRAGFWWPELLRAQFAAALNVKPFGQCRIMLPMVTSLGEVTAARAILDAVREELGDLDRPPFGVMIETPSSALIADQLVREVDFLSIGTNDLSQYVLAMDRGHPQLAGQIDALHPAVLRVIKIAADAANAVKKPIGVCGGLAADPVAAPILVGLGIGELSMPSASIPDQKALVHRLTFEQCRTLAQEALTMESGAAVRTLVRERLSGSTP